MTEHETFHDARLVQALQAARERANRFPGPPAPVDGLPTVTATDDSSAVLSLAQNIPGYRITGEIRRGGQGVVYRAVQSSTRRDVAIKLYRESALGLDADRARYEREVRILGAIRHPNIVTIHDAGTVCGHQYFVTEYIAGRPLDPTEWARRPIREAVRLFALIAEAVNAAHLRGILHRDLKPQNVLLDEHDVPHILDFGLAKDRQGPDDPSSVTLTGQFVGSLAWASPEQADSDPSQVDLRTDVYSLGVILYQLLTGQFPYDVSGGLTATIRRIQSDPPIRPRSLRGDIDADIETIVLKCLAKERERRYQTAGELAADMRRWLAGEPIDARRDSTAYVLRKLARQHRGLAAVAALFFLSVVAGGTASFVLWQKAVTERNRAETTKVILSNVLDGLRPLFTKSSSLAPARAVLNENVAAYDAMPGHDPVTEFELRTRFGGMYTSLRDPKPAAAQYVKALSAARRAFGDSDSRVAKAAANLAQTQSTLGEAHNAQMLFREAAEILEKIYGTADRRYLEARLCEVETLRIQRKEADYESLIRATIELADRHHPDQFFSNFKSFAEWLYERKRYEEAWVFQQRAIASARRVGTPNELAHTLNSAGELLAAMGRWADAESRLRECVDLRSQLYSPDDVEQYYLFVSKSLFGEILTKSGKFEEAEAELKAAFEGLAPLPSEDIFKERGRFQSDTAKRLVTLYESWNAVQPNHLLIEKAAEWRAQLAHPP